MHMMYKQVEVNRHLYKYIFSGVLEDEFVPYPLLVLNWLIYARNYHPLVLVLRLLSLSHFLY